MVGPENNKPKCLECRGEIDTKEGYILIYLHPACGTNPQTKLGKLLMKEWRRKK